MNQSRIGLLEMLGGNFANNMSNVSTQVPGRITAFNPATQRAQVQMGIVITDTHSNTTYDPPVIVDVPVSFPGDDFSLEYSIAAGCEGMIHFSQRCIDGWKQTGGIAQNPSLRTFNKQDAVFVPGIRSIPNAIVNFTNDGIRLRNDDATQHVWLKNDGSIAVSNGTGSMVLGADGSINLNGVIIDKDGKMTVPASLKVASKELANHTHSGVTSGGSNTGVNN